VNRCTSQDCVEIGGLQALEQAGLGQRLAAFGRIHLGAPSFVCLVLCVLVIPLPASTAGGTEIVMDDTFDTTT
jgi:hypothetical protein